MALFPRARDVGTIVDRPQRAVPLGDRREHLEQAHLLAGLEALLTKLHDVNAVAEHGVEELLEVTVPGARVDAQVETSTTQAGHGASVVFVAARELAAGGLRGQQPTVKT